MEEIYVSKRKIIFSILKELDKGEHEPTALNYDISTEEFGDIVDMMLRDGLITGGKVIRGGMGHKALMTFLNTAKIEMKGLDYLEENSFWAKTYKGIKEVKSWISLT
jgi:predicted transcriptional regulator